MPAAAPLSLKLGAQAGGHLRKQQVIMADGHVADSVYFPSDRSTEEWPA